MNWNGHEVAAALAEQLLIPPDNLAWNANGVSIDTRTLNAGNLFIALNGPRFNAADFLPQAAKQRAIAAIAETTPHNLTPQMPVFKVRDSLKGLTNLAQYARDNIHAKRIAITGSSGKTSMRELLTLALKGNGEVHSSVKSYNNQIGVSLTLARMTRGANFAVLEIGTNNPGEIKQLTNLVLPELAILTAIGSAHIGHFHSHNELAREKAQILQQLKSGSNAVVHHSTLQHEAVTNAAQTNKIKIHSYGNQNTASAKILSIKPNLKPNAPFPAPFPDSVSINAEILGEVVQLQIKTPAKHHAHNAIGALLAAKLLGANLKDATNALHNYSPSEGRGNIIPIHLKNNQTNQTAWLLNDSYNANPESMTAALQLLASANLQQNASRIAILADMAELGPQAQNLHLNLADQIINANINQIYLIGTHSKHLATKLKQYSPKPHIKWSENINSINLNTNNILQNGNVILIKGSNNANLNSIVEQLRKDQR
ncbi:MAG: UDP-N-acetylmuramoyl-tripeptide--D-alanyl-D-alanine ligase [Alphaproteobacteria bacterium]